MSSLSNYERSLFVLFASAAAAALSRLPYFSGRQIPRSSKRIQSMQNGISHLNLVYKYHCIHEIIINSVITIVSPKKYWLLLALAFVPPIHHANGQKTWPEKRKRWKDMGSQCQQGNDQQLKRLSDRIRTAKNRGRERDGRSRFRNFVALTLGEGERQPKKRHRSPPCVSPGTKKTRIFFRVRQMFYAQNSLAFSLL